MSHSEDNQHFDDQMRQRFEDASFAPPPGIWDKIQDDLPPALPFYRKYKYAIVAAIFAFSFISSHYIYNKYDYASSMNEFMTDNLRDSEILAGDATVISGLNISEMSRFVVLNHYRQNERNYNASIKAQLEAGETEVSTFANGNAVAESNKALLAETQQNSTGSGETSVSQKQTEHGSNQKVSSETATNRSAEKSDKQQKRIKKKSAKSDPDNNSLSLPGSNNQNINHLASENSSSIESRNRSNEENIELDKITVDCIQNDEESPYAFNAEKIAQKLKNNHHQNRGFFIGPVLGAQYSAMTKSSKEGVNTSRMEQVPTFGTFYGLSAGYIINSRWTVGVEWIYNSAEGQKFEEPIENTTVDKFIDLDYMKIPVYIKYRQKFLHSGQGVPATFNLLGGLHYSRLKSTSTYINGEVEPFEINYNKQQWGLMAGFEFDLYPVDRIFFTFGGRASFNADLAAFPSLRGANGTAPFSVQTGLYAKIHYVFNKKQLKKITAQ